MTSTHARLALAMLCLLGPLTGRARGQDEAPNLRITAVGGFLGYRDGLTVGTSTRGGLIAFEEWFTGQIKSGQFRQGDLLLVSGNNMPLQIGAGGLFSGPGWSSILSANPTAIALSVDDLRRVLAPADGIAHLINGLDSATGLPLVASNAIKRIRKDGLNVVKSEGFELEISADESIDWKTSIRVDGGTCTAVTWALFDRGTPSAPVPDITCTNAQDGHFTLALKPSLRPGRTYELEITPLDLTKKKARFEFMTHHALVTLPDRVGNDPVPAALQGLPVRVAIRNFYDSVRTPLLIIAMVDPDLKKGLGADRWKWKPTVAPCPGTECEIDFLPATDAFKTIVSLATGAPKDPPPVVVLMSGLTDRQTLALVSTLKDQVRAAVPVVVLDPDSSVLGQDLGFESIVNGGTSQRDTSAAGVDTQVWVRPPWTGQRAAIIRASLNWSNERWRVVAPSAFAEPISAQEPTSMQTGSVVQHSISGTVLGTYPAYAAYRGGALSSDNVWNGLAALFLDVMRRNAGADLAMLPKHFIDTDIVAWLAGATKTVPLPLSIFTLEKSIYQTENIVTVAIEGSKLSAALAAIVKAENTAGEEVFVAGIGATGAQSQIDTRHLLVNGRAIVSDRFYKVALPQSLAETNSLTVASDDAIPSLLQAVDTHLRTRGGPVLRTETEIADPEKAFAGRKQLYFTLNPAKFSYFRATPSHPIALKAVPLAGRAVKEERQWAISGKGDFGLDAPRWALRETGELKFAKDTLSTPPTYPEDEWTSGGRFDVKFHAGNVRLFTGGFRQSQFRYRQDAPVTPTRTLSNIVVQSTGEVVGAATTKGATVTPLTQDPDNPDRPSYTFWRTGIEALSGSATPWLSVKNTSAAFDVGHASNERTGVVLGGLGRFDIADVYKIGMDAFLSDLFTRHPDAFSTPQDLVFDHDSHPQNRLQIDATLDVKGQSTWWKWLRGMTVTNTVQYRRYFNEDERPAFTAKWSADLKSTVEWTVINRLKLGPYVNYYRVGVSLPENTTIGKLDYLKLGIEINIPLFISFRPASTFQ